MCLPIDCWLCCMPRTIDDDPAPASRTARNGGGHYNVNGHGGHHYNNGNGHVAHGRVPAEADRKASNDARRDHAHVVAAGAAAAAHRGWQLAAWNGRVAADGHGAARGGMPHNYYDHAQLPAHREDAADSHYTAATATADHER